MGAVVGRRSSSGAGGLWRAVTPAVSFSSSFVRASHESVVCLLCAPALGVRGVDLLQTHMQALVVFRSLNLDAPVNEILKVFKARRPEILIPLPAFLPVASCRGGRGLVCLLPLLRLRLWCAPHPRAGVASRRRPRRTGSRLSSLARRDETAHLSGVLGGAFSVPTDSLAASDCAAPSGLIDGADKLPPPPPPRHLLPSPMNSYDEQFKVLLCGDSGAFWNATGRRGTEPCCKRLRCASGG